MDKTHLEILQFVNLPVTTPDADGTPRQENLLEKLKSAKGMPTSMVWRIGTMKDDCTRLLADYFTRSEALKKQHDGLLAELEALAPKPEAETEESTEDVPAIEVEPAPAKRKSKKIAAKAQPETQTEIEQRRTEIEAEYKTDFDALLAETVTLPATFKRLSAVALFGNPDDLAKYPGASGDAAELLAVPGVTDWLRPWVIDDMPEATTVVKGKGK